MPPPHQKLAESLAALQLLQKGGQRVFESRQFKRLHRERLLKNGFLQEVISGWLISSAPGVRAGDTTSWFASFGEFCAKYCEKRFASHWCLSPEQSLLLHAEKTVIPRQVVIHSPKGANNKIALPFGTSLYDLKQTQMPEPRELVVRDCLRLLSNTAALLCVSEIFFRTNPLDARVNLESVRDPSEVLVGLLDVGRSTIAGRLVGAFRHVHRHAIAEEILETMRSAGYDVREANPFAVSTFEATPTEVVPPTVLQEFPAPPGLHPGRHNDTNNYLRSSQAIYRADA